MKIPARPKLILHVSLAVLFLSGAAYFLTPQMWMLRTHSITSLWFFGFFGYLYARHIEPARKKKKLLKSGYALLITFLILFITVPGLFYIVHDGTRNGVILAHTYIGLILPLFFLAHRTAGAQLNRK
jgi:uncharacterized protein involved in response to NO